MELLKEAWATLVAGYDFQREQKHLDQQIEEQGFVKALEADIAADDSFKK